MQPGRTRTFLSGALEDGRLWASTTALSMRQDLFHEQWDAVDGGHLTAPTGTAYSRRTTRLKRKEAASLVVSGCPLVTYLARRAAGEDAGRLAQRDDARARV